MFLNSDLHIGTPVENLGFRGGGSLVSIILVLMVQIVKVFVLDKLQDVFDHPPKYYGPVEISTTPEYSIGT